MSSNGGNIERRVARAAEAALAQRKLVTAFALPSPHLALEVDGDRPPIADEVVEQKPRRAMILHIRLEVSRK
ncbi:MAG: hypothetical protein ABSG43_16490 [Solirubrobacteraceae bacterium]